MRRPLEGSYWTTFTIVMIALCPNIVVTTAWSLIAKPLGHTVQLGPTGLAVVEGLSNAGYAFGALVGGDLAQRFRQRPLFLACEALFVAGCVLAAAASGWPAFAIGRVVQGLATGFLLVVAIPPLVQRFPAERLPTTAAGVNVGFFGAVTAGPLVGGAVAQSLDDWRWLFAGLGAVGLAGILLSLLSLPSQEAPNPELKADWAAFGLGAVGTAAPFVGVALLTAPTRGYASVAFWLPLVLGAAALAALLVVEYRKDDALSPVRELASTLPALGTIVAMLAGAIFVTVLELALGYLTRVSHDSPLDAGLTVWPEVVTLVVTAVAFWFLIRTRLLAPFVLVGLVALAAGAAVLTQLGRWNAHALVLGASALLGLGAGATVSPALWLAGWSVRAQLVGRVFALVELVRAEADYVMGPVLSKVATTSAGAAGAAHGIRHAVWLTTLIALATIALCLGIWIVGRQRLQRPDLERYVEEGEPALESAPLAAATAGPG